ncbi:Src1p KNAG_0B03400 [Huiozyma naganishii CBS 8797]|uniref:Man1/Src1 C-terminal domain-containing protein n=1 Tax=Huiozyma naganishii (strain ATCC MYA-139 / BCRC 22969 / CBS 8797 / KCTC 17520 / NBRC 10181 / NCYC 3082 / Yp74L-3) TaxID=1071383 RepID=J7RV54_HUIN7|nr:hypothetical protein KNAG_0B03400 [Kazachstania naganishii CBS 8797]CCK68782.1 hypothetical protein KNAG_0B03400 [Kazachstania naganishii CBS 8797]
MDLKYLEPGSEPERLKVPELRRILTENDVEYSPNAKKKALVAMYHEFIDPLLPSLREKFQFSDSSSGTKKRKRRSVSRDVTEESDDSDGSLSSASSVDDAILERLRRPLETPQKKKQRVISSDESVHKGVQRTPIVDKLNGKEPVRTPQKSVKITEFGTSSSEESDNDTHSSLTRSLNSQGSKSSNQAGVKYDFSYKRRTLSPDLNKLKISPAFAKQLKNTRSRSSGDSTREWDTAPSQRRKVSTHPDSGRVSGFESDINTSNTNAANTAGDNDEPVGENSEASRLVDFENMPQFKETGKEASEDVPLLAEEGPDVDVVDTYPEDDDIVELVDLDESVDRSTFNMDLLSNSEVEKSQQRAAAMENELSPEFQRSEEERDSNTVSPSSMSDSSEDDEAILISEDDEAILISDEKESTSTSVSSSVDLPVKRTKKPVLSFLNLIKKLFSTLLKLAIFAIFLTTVLLAIWYRNEKLYTGFCGHGMVAPSLQELAPSYKFMAHIDDLLKGYKPHCIPCPENAICYPYLKMRCKPEYRLERSKLAFFDLFPIPDKCVKDSQREKLIAEVVKKSLEFLRVKNAQIECGEGNNDIVSGISEGDLFQIFEEAKPSFLDNEQFEELWEDVVCKLKNEPDIIYRQVSDFELFSTETMKNTFTNRTKQLHAAENEFTNEVAQNNGANEVREKEKSVQHRYSSLKSNYLRSFSKKYISLRCQFEQDFYRTYQRYRYFIWGALGIIAVIKYIEHRLKEHFREKKLVNDLVERVIAKLKKNKEENKETSFLSAVQLRDSFLSGEGNLRYRNSIWNRVTKVVETKNTNIKSDLIEVHGDIMKCWKWIGETTPLSEMSK